MHGKCKNDIAASEGCQGLSCCYALCSAQAIRPDTSLSGPWLIRSINKQLSAANQMGLDRFEKGGLSIA
jgi:hypothetical protein